MNRRVVVEVIEAGEPGAKDRGFTIVELAVALFVTALISTVMVSFVSVVTGADDRLRSDDLALGDLRDVSERLSRELRYAQTLTIADSSVMGFWADLNRDGELEDGETITWSIDAAGVMTRTTDSGESSVIATLLDPSASSFSYDAVDPADVATVAVTLVSKEREGSASQLTYESEVFLRNS